MECVFDHHSHRLKSGYLLTLSKKYASVYHSYTRLTRTLRSRAGTIQLVSANYRYRSQPIHINTVIMQYRYLHPEVLIWVQGLTRLSKITYGGRQLEWLTEP